MSLETSKTRLLKLIAGYKKDRDIEAIQKELEEIKKGKAAAYKQMQEHEKKGEGVSLERSRQAYNYCCKYEKQLEHIIDGYNHRNSGKVFTKDALNRYIDYKPKQRKDL